MSGKPTIKTNHHSKELISWQDLPAKRQADFDYVENEDRSSRRFFKYRGEYYCRRSNQNRPVRVELKPATFSPSDLARYFPLLMAIPMGKFSPVMKLALIADPVVASYSPTEPLREFATRSVLPLNASPSGFFRRATHFYWGR
jgi:hypothetical protein